MDRISALRNVEDALERFENDELSLPDLEREVRGTLRTYATDFDDDRLYRASGDPAADGLVVLAPSRSAARQQIDALLPDDTEPSYDVETVE